jgi:hypothetical protein
MAQPNQETIHDLLVRNIPRGLVMGLEEAMLVGAQRAYAAARGMDDGHLPSVVGQLRHFHMNESFHRALDCRGRVSFTAARQPDRHRPGRDLDLGTAQYQGRGLEQRAAQSQPENRCPWRTRPSSRWFNPGLFSGYVEPSQAVVFIVACFAGSLRSQPDTPVSIEIAVPDRQDAGLAFPGTD